MKKIKKGFTLVELLVVISVIAILTSVSIVTYFSVTQRAQESNDISWTSQMNNVLQTEAISEGASKTPFDLRKTDWT